MIDTARRLPAILLAFATFASPALAQNAPAAADAAEEIVVTARRSGAPTWEIRTGTATILLVGEIRAVPKATPWQPDRLEAATERADRVILGTRAKLSVGDVFRLLFRGGKLRNLPDGRTIADYLSPADQQRLAAVVKPGDEDYRRRNLLLTGFGLLTERLRFNRDTGDDATDVVRRAARRADVTARPVGTVRGEELLDTLFAAPPETHVPCLQAAIAATEGGAAGIERRGRDWTQFDIAAVMASPIEGALGACWPWSDDRFGPELRGQWTAAVDEALAQPGVTLAVVPLRVLAEPGGVLDRLAARGADIRGPAWKGGAR